MDSSKIGIDNLCSACISHKIDSFIGPLKYFNISIMGSGGEIVYNAKMGIIQWKWCDDQRKEFTFRIPTSYYVSDGKIRLLSPQHW